MNRRFLTRALLCAQLLLGLSACAALQQPSYIDPTDATNLPAWALIREDWDSGGLSVAAYATAPYSISSDEEGDNPRIQGRDMRDRELALAEEAAVQKAKELILTELTAAYLSSIEGQDNYSDSQIRTRLSRSLRSIQIKRRFYDQHRRIFHVQVFVSNQHIQNIYRQALNLDVSISASGTLQPLS